MSHPGWCRAALLRAGYFAGPIRADTMMPVRPAGPIGIRFRRHTQMIAELTFAVVLAFGGAVSTQMREIDEAERAAQPAATQPAGAVPVISSPTLRISGRRGGWSK